MHPHDLAFHPNCVHMKVNNGSKIKNLIGFAMTKIKDEKVIQISWNGYGQAVTKVLSCVEIMKRKVKNLHQITELFNKRIEEYWEPKMDGLERLRINKDYPAVCILLSKEPLDTTHPSYQPPGLSDGFWRVASVSSKKQEKRRPHRAGDAAAVPLEKKKKINRKNRQDNRRETNKSNTT